jgi:hypothetical protein
MTDEMKQNAQRDFAAMLDGVKMSDGKLNYNINFKYDDCDAVVWLSPDAYKKTVALITEFKDEVGWHGTVSRLGDTEFIVEDVFVYPQDVTGSTVNTDQTAYTEWLYGLDDETFNKIRMQGHSHVNMGVSPSGVDDSHRQKILEQLEPDMFYIFMIWNKSLSVHTLIYDMARNVLYEDKDITVKLFGGDEMDGFMADAKDKVRKTTSRTSVSSVGANKKSKSGSKKQTAANGIYEGIESLEALEAFGYYEGFEYHDYEYPPLFRPFDPYDISRKSWK